MAPGSDQVEKGEDEANTRCAKFGGRKRFRLERTAEEMKPSRRGQCARWAASSARRARVGTECPAGCPTTVGKPERNENTGGEFEHMVGHPIVA